MTREQISRLFDLFGTVIAASTQDTGRRRTSYFYRKEAIAWARMSRQGWPGWPRGKETCRNLAKRYLAHYRQMEPQTNQKPGPACLDQLPSIAGPKPGQQGRTN